jgi:hypothetical protein
MMIFEVPLKRAKNDNLAINLQPEIEPRHGTPTGLWMFES